MKQAKLTLAITALALLAGCDGGAPEADDAAPPAPPAFGIPNVDTDEFRITPAEAEALAERDCRDFVEAYSAALGRGAYEFAAEFWDDPVIDAARLAALHAGYVTPSIEIARVYDDEEVDDPATCTITGALLDAADARTAPQQGEIELRLGPAEKGGERWRIQSATFIEPMQRAGKGEPA